MTVDQFEELKKNPWTSSKKWKKRAKNENTALNERAKVGDLYGYGIKPANDRSSRELRKAL